MKKPITQKLTKQSKRPDANIVIVQLLSDKPKQKKLIEKAIFQFCNEANIKVIIRMVEQATLSQNFIEWEWVLDEPKAKKLRK